MARNPLYAFKGLLWARLKPVDVPLDLGLEYNGLESNRPLPRPAFYATALSVQAVVRSCKQQNTKNQRAPTSGSQVNP